ncbi:putative oxidoreductase [Candidatus Moduliflexus flocculans]|uniref:Putative oxidoreductase n=1 Tax=Candidatus Moduliflexus flocculans TaxID=1499966 RepID=A0A081BQR6_9BACT|nr:putative oxidoreductase [Candidatus Moduliflexus flocculans]
MKYNSLGDTGIKASSLCMGTMTFGKEADHATSAAIFHRCREAGINFFDCADVYAEGEAERILGELIADCRDQVIISSKVSGKIGADINAKGSSRRHIMNAVEASLRRLKTEYLDLYFLHHFDPETALEETLCALDDLVHQGKVLYLGASNFAAWQVMKALSLSALHGWQPFSCLQPMYNLVKRQAEVEILPMAQAELLGVVTYSPLGGGLLTGKYPANHQFQDGRFATNPMYQRRYGEDWMYDVAHQFIDVAQECGVHPACLAIAWVASHPAVTAPIIGARNIEQLNVQLAAADFSMAPELYDRLCSLSPTPPPANDRTDEAR